MNNVSIDEIMNTKRNMVTVRDVRGKRDHLF